MALDTQNKKILHYLETHKRGITSMDAFQKFGITRLSGRVFDLRQMGYLIDTVQDSARNRDGKLVYFARYRLRGEK